MVPPHQKGKAQRNPRPRRASQLLLHHACDAPNARELSSFSFSGGGGDGGEPGGRAVAGSDARAAPPHEVQLQARQAPHPHRYGVDRSFPIPYFQPSSSPALRGFVVLATPEGQGHRLSPYLFGIHGKFSPFMWNLGSVFFFFCMCGEETLLPFAMSGLVRDFPTDGREFVC